MKSKLVAYLLLLFLGGLGVHRFYLGKVGTGILYFFTFGLFGFGLLYDLFTLAGQVDLYNTHWMVLRTPSNISQNQSVVVNVGMPTAPSSSASTSSSRAEVIHPEG